MVQMTRPILIAAAILISSSAASAQTKDQCAGVMRALIPFQTATDKGGEMWAKMPNAFELLLSKNVSGNFKSAAEEATAAQANLIAAIRRFRIAIEEVVHEAQLCAR